MIEGSNCAPFADFMAVLTVLTQISFVGLVLIMATEAGSCGLRPFFIFQMASVAFNLLMGADKLVIRCLMIKGFTVKLYDVSFSSLMLLMTVTAGDISHQFAFAVKTGQCHLVRGDLLMTRKAEHILGAL